MSSRNSTSTAVGAEDFLAKFAPNLSRKERSGLTSMVRLAVRDYMEENRLAQPPPHRLLAAYRQENQEQLLQHRRQHRPASAAAPQPPTSPPPPSTSTPRQRRRQRLLRPSTAMEDDDGKENLCLVGNPIGIVTADTPRYAMVSPKFAPPQPPRSARTAAPSDRRHFPDTLMGFVDTEDDSKEQQQQQQQPAEEAIPDSQPKPRPATAAGAAPSGGSVNWLSWRGSTPFCASDRELMAFRHRQNPKKPPPPPTPRFGGLSQQTRDPNSDCSPADRGILDWLRGASDHDKQVAHNLLKAIGSGRRKNADGLEAFSMNLGQERGGASPALAGGGRWHSNGSRQSALMGRQLREAGAEQPFAGLVDEYTAARGRVHPLRPPIEYTHPGAGFSNSSPTYRGNFVVHPDWVSEQQAAAAPAATSKAPQPRRSSSSSSRSPAEPRRSHERVF